MHCRTQIKSIEITKKKENKIKIKKKEQNTYKRSVDTLPLSFF